MLLLFRLFLRSVVTAAVVAVAATAVVAVVVGSADAAADNVFRFDCRRSCFPLNVTRQKTRSDKMK